MISGKHTLIRSLEKSDLEQVRKWNFDAEIRRFLPSALPINEEEQKLWFENLMKDSSKKKFIIQLKEKPISIGVLSIMKIDSQNQNAEIGWTIGEKGFQNKGFATDALKCFIHYLFHELNLHMVYAFIMEGNEKSIHLAENKLKFKHTGKFSEMIFSNGKFNNMLLYCLTKNDYLEHLKTS